MGGSGRGGFLLSHQPQKEALFLRAVPFLGTTLATLWCTWSFDQVMRTCCPHLAVIPSYFLHSFTQLSLWHPTGPLLVVGNPPWVTNAELGTLGSNNLPHKKNLKGLRGIEARTGGSNFDIAEYIWLKLIQELASEQPTIALLCKASVARNVLQFAFDTKLP